MTSRACGGLVLVALWPILVVKRSGWHRCDTTAPNTADRTGTVVPIPAPARIRAQIERGDGRDDQIGGKLETVDDGTRAAGL